MRPVSRIQGQMVPLPRANVDTDQIIPKQFLKRIERSGFGPYLFYDWAYDEHGEPIADFILNNADYSDAKVMVSGPNFGSGSSREHAAWSLEDHGFEAVVAPSFADIFYNNCINIGLLPVVLPDATVAALTALAEDPGNVVTIDLGAQSLVSGDVRARFDIDPFAKNRLLNGLDRIALTLRSGTDIDAYEATRPSFLPSLG